MNECVNVPDVFWKNWRRRAIILSVRGVMPGFRLSVRRIVRHWYSCKKSTVISESVCTVASVMNIWGKSSFEKKALVDEICIILPRYCIFLCIRFFILSLSLHCAINKTSYRKNNIMNKIISLFIAVFFNVYTSDQINAGSTKESLMTLDEIPSLI